VAGVGGPWRGRRLDLHPDEAAAGQLGEKVDLEPALLLANVVQARSGGGDGDLGAQLADDERVEQPAQEIPVPEHGVGVKAQHTARKRGIDEMPLGREDEALERVGRHGRERLDDEQAAQQPLVGLGGLAVDPGRLEQVFSSTTPAVLRA
jgi:hypothetical protein